MSPTTALPTDVTDAPDAPAFEAEATHGRGGRPRDEARELAILDAALALVAEVGYDRMSMDAVAAAARASKATIYRRWPGKVELVVAAPAPAGGDPFVIEPAGDLRTELLAFVHIARTAIEGLDGGIMRGIAAAAGTDPELAAAIHAEFGERKESAVDAVIARAVERGQLAPDVRAAVLHEAIPAVIFFRHLQCGALDDDFEAHVVDDIALPLLHAPIPHHLRPPEHRTTGDPE